MAAAGFHRLYGVDKEVVKDRTQKLGVGHDLRHILMLDDADLDAFFGGFGLDDAKARLDDAPGVGRLQVGFCGPRII
jgi:hypothetical protein